MDIDFVIDEINREQDYCNLLEAKLEAAEKRVEEERLVGMKWFDELTATGAQLDEAKQRVAELEEALNTAHKNISAYYDQESFDESLLFAASEVLKAALDK